MQIHYVGHACLSIECGGLQILTDPWISGTAGGRYVHEPPLVTPLEEISSPDVIVLSHAHPDHFHQESLERLDHQAVFIVPKHFGTFETREEVDIGWRNPDLAEEVEKLGFERVHPVEPGQEVRLGDDVCIASIASHHRAFPEMGMVIQGPGGCVYNGVDTWPHEDVLKKVATRYRPDVAFLPFRYYLADRLWVSPELPEEERQERLADLRRRFRWVGPMRAAHAAGVLEVDYVVPGAEGFRDVLSGREAFEHDEGPNYHEISVGEREDFVTMVERHLSDAEVCPMGPGDEWSGAEGFVVQRAA